MKKKIFSFLISFCLILPAFLSLTACKKGNNDDEDPNADFTEFSTVAVSIMNNYDLSNDDGDFSAGKGELVYPQASGYSSKTIEERIFDEIKASDSKQVVTNINYYYVDLMEQVFTTTLGSGDALTNKYGVSSFFGLKTKVLANSEYGTQTESFVVNKAGTTYSIDHYYKFDATSQDADSDERFNYGKIEYSSKDEYKVTLLSFTRDFSNFTYSVADSNFNFTQVKKYTWDSVTEWSMVSANGVLYCYSTEDADLIAPFYEEYYTTLNGALNFSNYIESSANMPNLCTCSVTETEVYEAYEKYVDMSGSDGEYIEPALFRVYNGAIVNGAPGYNNTTDEGLEIMPTNASMLTCGIAIPSGVKKLIIPSNVTKIVCEKMMLEEYIYKSAYENATGAEAQQKHQEYLQWQENYHATQTDPKWQEWVEVTPEYFVEYFKFVKERDNSSDGWNPLISYVDFEVEVAEGSSLFTKKADGNIYVTIDDQEILAFMNNQDILDVGMETLTLGLDAGGLNFGITNEYFFDSAIKSAGLIITKSLKEVFMDANTEDLLLQVKNLNITSSGSFVDLYNLAYVYNYEMPQKFNFENVTITFTESYGKVGLCSEVVSSIDNLTINCAGSVELDCYCFNESGNIVSIEAVTFGNDVTSITLMGDAGVFENINKNSSTTLQDQRTNV